MAEENKTLFRTLSSKIKSKDMGSLLSKLFRQIIKETGLINKIGELRDRYVESSKLTEHSKEKTPSQVNTMIGSEQMSWKTFIDLTVNLLRVKKITIIIKLDHGKNRITQENKITIHELTMKAIDDGTSDSSFMEDENKNNPHRENKN